MTNGPIDANGELERLRARAAALDELEIQWEAALDELRREKEFSETILNSMRDAIYVVEAESYRIINCNQVFLTRYGFSREQVIGRPCYEVKRRRDAPCIMEDHFCPSLDSFRTGRPAVNELVLINSRGEEIFTECSTAPAAASTGRPAVVVHVDRDITQRKLVEQRLRDANHELSRSNALLRNLINSSIDAVIASDMTGKILIFNEAAGQIMGYGEQEALSGLNIRDVYPGDGARQVMRMLRSAEFGGKGKLSSHDVEVLTKHGERVPIRLSAAAVMDGDREAATVGFFYDLREKLRIQRELDKTKVQLLQAEKMASIGKLAAGVAHQLNNPLSGITLYARLMLEDYDLAPGAREDLLRILANAQRSRDTIRELLQFARQTSQTMRGVNVNAALRQTIFLLKDQSIFHDVEIVQNLDPELKPVHADVQQLNHVFMNLILNAADAMEGRGRLTVTTRPGPGGRSVEVEISDTGPGIPAEALPHLFEPFFTTKEQGKGTGLGLSVAYGIIQSHRGRIQARNLSPGACFTIELPPHTDQEKSNDA